MKNYVTAWAEMAKRPNFQFPNLWQSLLMSVKIGIVNHSNTCIAFWDFVNSSFSCNKVTINFRKNKKYREPKYQLIIIGLHRFYWNRSIIFKTTYCIKSITYDISIYVNYIWYINNYINIIDRMNTQMILSCVI